MNTNPVATNCTTIKNVVYVDVIDGDVYVVAKVVAPVCFSDRFMGHVARPCTKGPAVNRTCHTSEDKFTKFLDLLRFGGVDVSGF